MALDSYTNLKTALTSWCNARSDVVDNVDDFIRLAEGHFNLTLRTRQMVSKTDLTPTSGAVTLPTDFIGVRRVVEKTNPRSVLTYIAPDAADMEFDTAQTGCAQNFTIIGDSLETFPKATNAVELTYYKELDGLDDSTASNWLLVQYPNLYLKAAQMFFYDWAKDTEEYAKCAQMVQIGIDQLNRSQTVEVYGEAGYTNLGITP